MCGIIGYIGKQNPKEILLQGLRRMEYRGYDSAGLAIIHNGSTQRVRAEGRLSNLAKKIEGDVIPGHIGIAHTRWATHGVPSERNAHPHYVGGVSVIHNGIIENYQDLRTDLLARGAKLTSETDSELIAHLVAEEVAKTPDLLLAVRRVLPRLRGAFSVVVMSEKFPEELVAFKDGPPLILGLGENENFIVSDAQAARLYTRKFIYLNDREIVLARQKDYSIYSLEGEKLHKSVHELEWTEAQAEKQGFSHFMLKEIYEEARAFANAIAPYLNVESHTFRKDILANMDLKQIRHIHLIACGTSYYAALMARNLIESMAKLSCSAEVASEFRYRKPFLTKKDLVLVISQSGETADTLAALRLAKAEGCKTASLVNCANSSIDRESDWRFYMNAGPEVGVASTKAFIATLGVLQCFSGALASAHDQLSAEDEKNWTQALLSVPSQIEVVLNHDKYFDEVAIDLIQHKGFLYMGRGLSYAIALEGALKMKELAYLHAEGYPAGEMKHGPLALIDKKMAMVILAPRDEFFEKTLSNLEEVRARGGHIIAIGSGDDEQLKSVSHRYLGIPNCHPLVHPALSVIPLQLMAFHVAKRLGHDVDQPRNLAKSVTVE